MKTYLKTLGLMYKKHIMRFLSIIFIVIVSVGLISGIGSSTENIKSSLNEFYIARNVSDFVLKSTADKGFKDKVTAIETLYGVQNVNTGMSLDVTMTVAGEEATVRLYFRDFAKWTVNTPRFVSGKTYTELASEGDTAKILCADSSKGLKSLETGEKVSLDFKDILTQSAAQAGKEPPMFGMLPDSVFQKEVEVAGIIVDTLAFTYDGEPSYIQEEGAVTPDSVNALDSLNTLDYIFYLPADIVPVITIPVMGEYRLMPEAGDMYIALPDRAQFECFSKNYEVYVSAQKTAIAAALNTEEYEVITLSDNYTFSSLNAYADKVLSIGVVFLVAFVLVTALVVSSNMSRLMDEERAQIACLRTLGYSGFRIILKYMLFALIAAGIAGAVSYFVGLGLAALIYYVFNYSYVMPPLASRVAILFYLITYFIIVAAIVAATLTTGLRLVNEKPAALLRPRTPKAGRKVFLEKIPFIWNALSFKYKSTMRNVLRYRSRFYMTVIAVACSMGLVLAGLALVDLCLFQDFGSAAIMGLAFVIVIFAGLLTMAVIYTLTGINISERNREIATLMVLGYNDKEVTGYIYREIYINTAIGIVFGYPVGVLLIWVVFKVMNFGALGSLSWFIWLVAPFIVLLFTFIVTLILRRKIVRIDMNESLKANE